METTDRRQKVFDWLDSHGIAYTWYEHPEAPTIEIARRYWRDDGSKHCKNLFFRNHKGNRHYLVAFDCEQNLAIHDLERRLRQGKLARTASRLGVALRADQRPGASRTPVSGPESGEIPGLFVPPQRQPRHGGRLPQRVPALPRRRRQYVRIHRTLLTPSCAAAIAADEKLPVRAITQGSPGGPRRESSAEDGTIAETADVVRRNPHPHKFRPVPLHHAPKFIIFDYCKT